jgi:hypothetical protein
MDKIIRLKGSDKVFLVKSTKHWLKTAEALTGLGFNFGDEVEVDASEFANYEEGEPIEINGAMKEPEMTEKPEGEVINFAEEDEKKALYDEHRDDDTIESMRELWQ